MSNRKAIKYTKLFIHFLEHRRRNPKREIHLVEYILLLKVVPFHVSRLTQINTHEDIFLQDRLSKIPLKIQTYFDTNV